MIDNRRRRPVPATRGSRIMPDHGKPGRIVLLQTLVRRPLQAPAAPAGIIIADIADKAELHDLQRDIEPSGDISGHAVCPGLANRILQGG